MGGAGGTALKVAAPEAAVASKAAGRGRRPAADPRRTAPGSKAAQQRQAIEQIKDQRPPEPAPEPQAPASPAPLSPGAGPSMPVLPAPVQTGSGLLLGVFVWALGLAYLHGGSAGVKKFMAAKFFNKV